MTLTGLVENLSEGYMVSQVGVITAFFVLGALFLQAFGGRVKRERTMGLLLAFPTGFSLFAVPAYLILCLGIPYGGVSISVGLIVLAVMSAGVIIRHVKMVDINDVRKELIIRIKNGILFPEEKENRKIKKVRLSIKPTKAIQYIMVLSKKMKNI